MTKVLIYSLLLVVGLVCSQILRKKIIGFKL